MSQVKVKSKQQDFTWGLILAGIFVVIVYKITDHVPAWALIVAVVGSLVLDRITHASPKKGVYIE